MSPVVEDPPEWPPSWTARECPYCGAEVGVRCKNMRDRRPVRWPHPERERPNAAGRVRALAPGETHEP